MIFWTWRICIAYWKRRWYKRRRMTSSLPSWAGLTWFGTETTRNGFFQLRLDGWNCFRSKKRDYGNRSELMTHKYDSRSLLNSIRKIFHPSRFWIWIWCWPIITFLFRWPTEIFLRVVFLVEKLTCQQMIFVSEQPILQMTIFCKVAFVAFLAI